MEIGLSFLGLGITFAAFIFAWIWQHVNTTNNKVIKELSTETRNMILEEGRLARESGERMEQLFRESSEKLGQLIVADGEKTRFVNARIAELIAADGERTREIIREIKKGHN